MIAGIRGASSVLAAALLLLALVAALGPPVTGTGGSSGPRLQLAAAQGDPAEPLTIRTVPPVAGFPVTLDGRVVLTDAAGQAHFPVTGEGDLTARIALNEAVLPIGGQRVKVSVDRFYPSSTAPTLALNLSYLVSFRYTDLDGNPIDAAKVGTVSLKGVTGEVVELQADDSVWLHGRRVIKRAGGLEVKDLLWSVRGVEYTGTNVVNASQQRFLPATVQEVSLELRFFAVELRVQDAIYGFSTGRAVDMEFPDGTTHRYPLGSDGRVSLPPLARGDYTLSIVGAGPEMPRPVAVTRDLDLELDYYSWLDFCTVLGAAAGFAAALALIGRYRRRQDRELRVARSASPHARHRRSRLGWRAHRADGGTGTPDRLPTAVLGVPHEDTPDMTSRSASARR